MVRYINEKKKEIYLQAEMRLLGIVSGSFPGERNLMTTYDSIRDFTIGGGQANCLITELMYNPVINSYEKLKMIILLKYANYKVFTDKYKEQPDRWEINKGKAARIYVRQVHMNKTMTDE